MKIQKIAYPVLSSTIYPASEDIYSKSIMMKDIDPDDISKLKESNKIDKSKSVAEKYFTDDMNENCLDIPGSELDDEQEGIGSEDEENNYYSLGGDNHNDLEEDRE
jgi:hypothetical protein